MLTHRLRLFSKQGASQVGGLGGLIGENDSSRHRRVGGIDLCDAAAGMGR
jgi:hypothetical protein